ncbi:unnamed protein product [Caenorhabditis sp. 36 PRJEB53466]|nr:unnamed protein product [Caenorhabditis sp. 36 PRJEB53466]
MGFSDRVSLASRSIGFRELHLRTKCVIHRLEFNQRELNYCGHLKVDDVRFEFEHDERTNQVEVRCGNGSCMSLTGMYTAKSYFRYYLTPAKYAVKHIEILHCYQPFHGLSNLRVPSIKWTFGRYTCCHMFSAFAGGHIFDKLELVGWSLENLREWPIEMCKHLVYIRPTNRSEGPIYGPDIKRCLWRSDTKRIIQATIQCYQHHMDYLCEIVLASSIGSYLAGEFSDSECSFWEQLIDKYPNAVQSETCGLKYFIIGSEPDSLTIAQMNGYRVFLPETNTFTLLKIPADRQEYARICDQFEHLVDKVKWAQVVEGLLQT